MQRARRGNLAGDPTRKGEGLPPARQRRGRFSQAEDHAVSGLETISRATAGLFSFLGTTQGAAGGDLDEMGRAAAARPAKVIVSP